MPYRYTKKPIEIEARQHNGSPESAQELVEWITSHGQNARWRDSGNGSLAVISIDTLEGTMDAGYGTYIIRGVQGEFYPCAEDIFNATYSPGGAASQSIYDLVKLAGETAETSGWHEGIPDPTITRTDHITWIVMKIMLVVSELSEAVEELRSGHDADYVYRMENGKPEGFPVEIADAMIRLFDLWWTLHSQGWEMPELGRLIERKIDYNTKRGARHGGKTV